jgi:hypothetical protein
MDPYDAPLGTASMKRFIMLVCINEVYDFRLSDSVPLVCGQQLMHIS